MLLDLAKNLKRLQARTNTDPLRFWRATPPQYQYIQDSSRIKLLLGGNQVGKTSASVALAIYTALGRSDLLGYATDVPPVEIWIVTHSHQQSVTIQEKLWEMLPKEELHPSVEFRRGKGFRGVNPVVHFLCGSIIKFRTAQQGLSLASATCSLVILDEPCEAAVFNEALARTLRGGSGGRAGRLALSMTPVGNVDVRYVQEMVEQGKISCTRAPLTVEATTPQGLAPLLTQEQIEEITSRYLPIDREARIYGSFNVSPVGVIYDCWDPTTMIINRPCPAGEYKYAIGIDNGTQPGAQCAILAAINLADKHPKVYILAEYKSKGGATPEDHARGILEMCKKHYIRPENCRWTGDHDHYGGRNQGHMSNLVLMRAFESILGLNHRCLGWTVRKAIKKRHSVYYSASVIYSIMKRGDFFVRSECVNLIDSIQGWTMKRESSARSRDKLGHMIDSLRYCLMGTLDNKYVSPSKVRIA